MPNRYRFLSVRDAADLLGVPQDRVRSWIYAGRLREYRIADTYAMRVSESELLELVKAMPHPSRLPVNR